MSASTATRQVNEHRGPPHHDNTNLSKIGECLPLASLRPARFCSRLIPILAYINTGLTSEESSNQITRRGNAENSIWLWRLRLQRCAPWVQQRAIQMDCSSPGSSRCSDQFHLPAQI